MWIGDTTTAEFQSAVEYCLVNVSQLAFRRDESEAISRPASDVRWIVFAKSNRSQFNPDRLLERYPTAKAITLLGPLCQGINQELEFTVCDWYEWRDELPRWLGASLQKRTGCRSVVVVASTLMIAEPLIDLAESTGATAIWTRHPGSQSIRNVDAVWWDDSVAPPVTADQWRRRTGLFSRHDGQVQHAWITHSTRMEDHREATTGGIDLLANKPHGIYNLLKMLQQSPAVGPIVHSRAA